MTFPQVPTPSLPPNTIVPQSEDLFIPYLNRLYEDIAFAVNNKLGTPFQIAITDVPADIPNLPNFGSFLVCVSGTDSGLPTLTASLCKSALQSAGSISVLGSQAGVDAPWVAATLTITSTATNFQIQHSVASTSGNFNLLILGTQ